MTTDDTNRPASEATSTHAWIDESSIERVAEGAGGFYVLAAVIASPLDCEAFRMDLAALLPKGAGRLHWRDESAAQRRKVVDAITGYGLTNLVVISDQADSRKQERARRKGMERMLVELASLEVSQVVIEARTKALNSRDQSLVATLRTSGALPTRMRVDFESPKTEPMLWIPDAVAGATGLAHRGGDAGFLAKLSEVTVQIDLRSA
ncbi:hypothetical protein [Nocardia vulneris]|uniref:Resolvase/invertase-type recombinase catalytic domain-containing protein n=1 Tax=Nocardia vulneris TaxID=1141657 RepID=A0ABR4ZME9_9NOCA|nr:hypothetical protein [Nocardia vulneris]KIA66466.1 hypothetical protein FG87_02465 [Nocardia vulneris]